MHIIQLRKYYHTSKTFRINHFLALLPQLLLAQCGDSYVLMLLMPDIISCEERTTYGTHLLYCTHGVVSLYYSKLHLYV